jgi:hypothetical protein
MPRLSAPPSIPSHADTLCYSVPAATGAADTAMLAVSSPPPRHSLFRTLSQTVLARDHVAPYVHVRWCESGTLNSVSCPKNSAPNIHRHLEAENSASVPEKNETSRSMREDLSISIISARRLLRAAHPSLQPNAPWPPCFSKHAQLSNFFCEFPRPLC